jgi:transposase
VEQLKAQYPDAEVELWAFDEHRLGLKPIVRKVWSKVGQRPSAVVHHRYQWLYLYGFVRPESGQSEWLILPRVNVTWFNCALREFAKAVGAGARKQVPLVIDGAGWHRSAQVEIPEGIHLELLPPYSPELQPAERLWPLTDEPLVNRKFETLEEMEDTLATRCVTLSEMPEVIRAHTLFQWWKGG